MSTHQPPVIAGFTFLHDLGSGGYSDVFLYRQNMPERDVAIKVLTSEVLNSDLVAAFEAEANLMARVSNHPAIASIFEASITADGRPYLVMEYCPPPSLGQRYRTQRLSMADALRIGIQICGAVETAHRAGIIHRDLKPANILFTEYHRPVLSDFGIATAFTGAPTQGNQGLSVPWAPPEIINNTHDNDTRTDIYSLGATIYALIAARSPFEVPGNDNTIDELLPRIVHSPPIPTGNPDSTESLERVLATALAKDPAARYSSAIEFGHALQLIQTQMGLDRTSIDIIDAKALELPADDSPDEAHTTFRTVTNPGTQSTSSTTAGTGPLLANPGLAPVPEPKKIHLWRTVIIASVVCAALVTGVTAGINQFQNSGPRPEPIVAQPEDLLDSRLKPEHFSPKTMGKTPIPEKFSEKSLNKFLDEVKKSSGSDKATTIFMSDTGFSLDYLKDGDINQPYACIETGKDNSISCKASSSAASARDLEFAIDDFDPKIVVAFLSNIEELSGIKDATKVIVTMRRSNGYMDGGRTEYHISSKTEDNASYAANIKADGSITTYRLDK